MSDAVGRGAQDARAALAGLAGPIVDWRRMTEARGALEPASARRSAVLMLFGPTRDAATATSATATSATATSATAAPATSAASATPAAVTPEDTGVLLLRRAATLRHHPGQIGFPGGGLEPGDADLSATAVREAVEETGLDPGGLELFAPLPELPLAISNNLVTPVPAWWRHPSPVHAADVAETAEVFFASVGDLLDPANRRNVERVRGQRIPRMPAFDVDGHLIWGFTAILLSGLFDTLGWTREWDAARLIEPDV